VLVCLDRKLCVSSAIRTYHAWCREAASYACDAIAPTPLGWPPLYRFPHELRHNH
jgi:hypothetical protein